MKNHEDYDENIPYAVDCMLDKCADIYNEMYYYHTNIGEKKIDDLLDEKQFLDFINDVLQHLITRIAVLGIKHR
tara:strand:- start:8392 stop:8613 length:222 start_codon:yes stop_codon:yes gene_type:complete